MWVFALIALDAVNVFFSVYESEIFMRSIWRFYDFKVRVITELFLKQVDEVLISVMGENVSQVILF